MASTPRIVSLLPSATEIVCELGLGEALVGRSHECDFPPGLDHLPVLTRPRLDIGATSGAIDRSVRELLEAGLSVYEVDAERLRALAPDVVLTQTQCEVCAVTPDDLDAALGAHTGRDPRIVSLAPNRLEEVWASFEQAGRALDVPSRGTALAERARSRCAVIAARAERAAGGRAPSVACIEWIDPLMTAGNWVPELVAAAGGRALLAAPGEHSPWLEPAALAAADPDVVIILPCGFDRARAASEARAREARSRWLPPRARREGAVAVTDGHQFFNRPGPRLVDSAEILAEILHPDLDFGHRERAWSWLTL